MTPLLKLLELRVTDNAIAREQRYFERGIKEAYINQGQPTITGHTRGLIQTSKSAEHDLEVTERAVTSNLGYQSPEEGLRINYVLRS